MKSCYRCPPPTCRKRASRWTWTNVTSEPIRFPSYHAGLATPNPLHVRRLELESALSERYCQPVAVQQPPVITLDPEAVFAGRPSDVAPVASDLPVDAQRIVNLLRCASGLFDAMLDAEHLSRRPRIRAGRWSPTVRRLPTRRSDERRDEAPSDLPEVLLEPRVRACQRRHSARMIPQRMSDWSRNYCEQALYSMPALGLYREVIHEKLSDVRLRWRDNDLIDMIYLTTAAGYCDYVVAERAHASHIGNALRRLGRPVNVHRSVRSLVETL